MYERERSFLINIDSLVLILQKVNACSLEGTKDGSNHHDDLMLKMKWRCQNQHFNAISTVGGVNVCRLHGKTKCGFLS